MHLFRELVQGSAEPEACDGGQQVCLERCQLCAENPLGWAVRAQGIDEAWEKTAAVVQQDEAEGWFLEHRGEAEKLLLAWRCGEPFDLRYAGVFDEARNEQDL